MLKDDSAVDIHVLSNLGLFKGLDIKLAEKFLSRAEHYLLPKGEVLFFQRSYNDDLYIVLSGTLSVHLGSPDSDLIATIGIGECAGEMSLFGEDATSACVVAADDSRVLKTTSKIVWDMINHYDGWARNLLHLLSSRIRLSNRIMLRSRRIQQHYEDVANIDSLTRLYNRRWIDQNLPQKFKDCITDEISVCLMVLDIDCFKKYNDDNGHQAGDACLKAVAEVIRINIRPNDLLGRFGGEEFVILLPHSNMRTCERVAMRIKDEVEIIEIIDNGNEVLPGVTISIGISDGRPGVFYEDVFKAADAALYQAKESGRNCIRY